MVWSKIDDKSRQGYNIGSSIKKTNLKCRRYVTFRTYGSIGVDLANKMTNALSERSAYGWSIMASNSIGYTNSFHLSAFRTGWAENGNILKGFTSNRFHWKYVPGIIKK